MISRTPASAASLILYTLVLLALCISPAGTARAADQKLVLTDGSDQVVRSYEIIGDRVRYFSSERMEWEELPKELIDWPATEAAKRAAEQVVEEERAKAAEIKPRVILEAGLGSPRLLMPEQEGIYVLAASVNDPVRLAAGLTKLNQAQAMVENDKKRSLLSMITPVPIIKGKARIVLPGKEATTAIRGTPGAIYIMLTPAEPEPKTAPKPETAAADAGAAKPTAPENPASPANSFALVRVRAQGNERQVGEIIFSPLGGAMSESRDLIPSAFELAFPAQIDADGDSLPVVWKLTPQAPLPAGEYAVIEYVEQQRQNLFVWDFRVVSQPAQNNNPDTKR